MPLILRFALLFCPLEYRREYAEQIASDIQRRDLSTVVAALDIVVQGVLMHLRSAVSRKRSVRCFAVRLRCYLNSDRRSARLHADGRGAPRCWCDADRTRR